MDGWRIFKHSVNLVINNLEAAFRLSIVLYVIQSLYAISSFLNPPKVIEQDGMTLPVLSPDVVGQNLIFGFLAVLASLWIAVAWHRYVLLNEAPTGWLPKFHGGPVLGYLGRSILIGLLIMVAVVVALIPVGIIVVGLPALVNVVWIPVVGVAAYLFFRLGIMLPATAMGAPMNLGAAWQATRGHSATILTLAGLVVAFSIVIELPSMLNNDPGSVINLIYALVMNWFATIIGISVLTTLYGHIIEGRGID